LHNWIKQKSCFTVNQRFYPAPGPEAIARRLKSLGAINGDEGSPAYLIAL
jgi:hypothetical protein